MKCQIRFHPISSMFLEFVDFLKFSDNLQKIVWVLYEINISLILLLSDCSYQFTTF